MNEFNQTPQKLSDDKDDLKQIKGIGQTIAQALISLGIYRYAELANFTPDKLAELLKTEVPSISSRRIENGNWLGQARALAKSQQKPAFLQPEMSEINDNSPVSSADEAHLPDEASIESKTELPSSSVDSSEQDGMRNPRDSWRELADFFVSFGYSVEPAGEERLQTKVHYSQADRFEQWDGIITDRLINWMLDQASLSSLTDTETEDKVATPAQLLSPPPTSEEETLLDLFLDLSNLWVSEVKVSVPAGAGYHSHRLQAECQLELSGPAAIGPTLDQLPFTVEFYLVETQTNRSKLTASYAGQLSPSQLIYEIQQSFPNPPVGRYQLYLVARLLPPGKAVTHLQGPIIRAEA